MKSREEVLQMLDDVFYRGEKGREEKLFILAEWEKSIRHSEAIRQAKKK